LVSLAQDHPDARQAIHRRRTGLARTWIHSEPDSGYDKRTVAEDVFQLIRTLGGGRVYVTRGTAVRQVDVVGHDIGGMVAFALAHEHFCGA
jgi:pimeloyl-ACP methyl ester carboxylesterase